MLISEYSIDPKIYPGFHHFGEYFSYARDFRPWVIEIGRKSHQIQIEAWDIYPASNIDDDTRNINCNISNKSLSPIELAKVVGHQPQDLQELAYQILKRQISVHKEQVLVLPGSSMIAIFYTLNIAFQQYFQSFHDEVFGSLEDNQSFTRKLKKLSYKKPCAIGVQGSFKCGGSFPFLNGGELIYAESSGNNFVPTAQSIADTFAKAEKGGRTPVAFIWEEPTAMGYIFQEKELAQVAEILKAQLHSYPQMIILVDAYNGGLFEQTRIPSLFDYEEIHSHIVYTTSMRKKIPAANYGLVTPIACGSDKLKQNLSVFFGSNSFYTVHPFSHLHYFVAKAIMEQFLDNGSSVDYNFPIFDFATNLIDSINSRLKGDYLKPYASPEAGINYFVRFDTELLKKKGCKDALHLCQVLSLVTGVHCSVPSAMGIPGYGVRINLMRSESTLRSEGFSSNEEYITSVFHRFEFFLLVLMEGHLNFSDFEKILNFAGREIQNFDNNIINLQNSFFNFMKENNKKELTEACIKIYNI